MSKQYNKCLDIFRSGGAEWELSLALQDYADEIRSDEREKVRQMLEQAGFKCVTAPYDDHVERGLEIMGILLTNRKIDELCRYLHWEAGEQ